MLTYFSMGEKIVFYEKNIVELNRETSRNLLEALSLIECLQDILEYSNKEGTILEIIKKNIKSSFNNIEKCREMTYIE